MVSFAEDGELLKTYTAGNGRTIERLEWQSTQEDHVIVSYPKNFDPKLTYNINFWFPGTGGKPTQGIEAHSDNYIGIGLSYIDRDKVPRGVGGYQTEHWKLCQAIESIIVKRKQLKVGQRVVSGVSKGGWMAYYFTLNPPKNLAGVAIIAAGRYLSAPQKANANIKNLSILVGVGETDSNYAYSQLCPPLYKKLKPHSFFYEEWLTQGHVSIISPRIQEWLTIQGLRGDDKLKMSTYCDAKINKQLEQIEQIESATQQYIALRHLYRSPAAFYISAPLKEKMRAQGSKLNQQESVQKWSADYKKLQDLVKKETIMYDTYKLTTKNLATLKEKYLELAKTTAFEDIAVRAAFANFRNAKIHAIQEKQEKYRTNNETFKKLTAEDQSLRKALNAPGMTQEKANEIFKKLDKVTPLLIKIRNEINMKAFYEVEWHKQYTLSDETKKLLQKESKQDRAKPSGVESRAYTGVAF